MQILIFSILALCGSAFAFTLEPPENLWVNAGNRAELNCRASVDISSCSWSTPYGSIYHMASGNTAESGRLEHFSEDKQDCGIIITDVKEDDHGKWTCAVGVSNTDKEVSSAVGHATLSLATRPSSIRLEEPFDVTPANLSLEATQTISCVVETARPKPDFSWYVGDQLLENAIVEDLEVEGQTDMWVQTLKYKPDYTHDNQSLRCVIEHVGLQEGDAKEAQVQLRFTDEGEIRMHIHDGHNVPRKDMIIYIVVACVLVISVCGFITVAYQREWFCFMHTLEIASNSTVNDNIDEEKGEAAAEDDTEKKDEQKDEKKEDAPMKKVDMVKYTDRMAKIFRFNRSFANDEGAKVEQELEPVVEDEKKPEEKTEEEEEEKNDADMKVEDAAAKDDTDAKIDDPEAAPEEPQTKTTSSFNRFASAVRKLFKSRHTVVDETKEAEQQEMMEKDDEEEKLKKDEAEKEKEELEPEDKPEIIEDNNKEAKAATPNTSF